MLVRNVRDCTRITAGDGTVLRELLHPDRDNRFTGRYSLAHAVLPPGKSSLKHRLRSDEVYYILAGQGRMYIDNEEEEVRSGDAIDIPPGAVQWISNTGDDDLIFLCIVDPAWREEDEQVLE